MKSVNQTITDFTNGNCFQACIASILEVSLDSIPNFNRNGPDGFWDIFNTFNWSTNYVLVDFYPGDRNFNYFADAYVIAVGESPRAKGEKDKKHCVVFKEGKMVHDPHPSGDGILGEPEFFTILITKGFGITESK